MAVSLPIHVLSGWGQLTTLEIDGVSIADINGVVWYPNTQHTIKIAYYNTSGLTFAKLGYAIKFDDIGHQIWIKGSSDDGESVGIRAYATRTDTFTFTVEDTMDVNVETVLLRVVGTHVNTSKTRREDVSLTGLSYYASIDNPTITDFQAYRVGNLSENITIIAKGEVQSFERHDYGVALEYSFNGEDWVEIRESWISVSALLLPAGISGTLSGFLNKGAHAYFRLRFWNDVEAAETKTVYVGVSNSVMHFAGFASGGVSFGGFSSSTLGNPKFESYYHGYFYDGIEGMSVMPGETLRFTMNQFFGYTTDSRRQIEISVPIGKSLHLINSVTCTKFMANIANDGGYGMTSSYLEGGSNYLPLISSITIDRESNSLYIIIKRSNAFTLTNNQPLNVRIDGTSEVIFSFS